MRFLGYAMIIGAMKSGTTTLHYILRQHPEIVIGVRKELNFFQQRDGRRTSVPAYEALFPGLDKTRHAYTLDSSPNYTKRGKWEFAPSLIAGLRGRKRLIYVLRDPLERIDSHIAHNVAQGRWTPDDWPTGHVVDVSAYARQLAKFETAGLLDDVLLLDFADLTADPVGVAYRVHDFLGIRRVRPKSVKRRNLRKLNGHFLRQDQRSQLAQMLRNDVETLITRYGFEPAKSWALEEFGRKQKPLSAQASGPFDAATLRRVEELRYSLGFLIGATVGRSAEHFRRIDFALPLSVHPRTQIALAQEVTEPLAILGEAVHPDLPHLDLQGIADHLGRNRPTRQREVDKLVGRFAIVQRESGGDWRIQTDAIGMRSVFFSASDDGVIAGSHARLVAEAVHGTANKKPRPFRWGYPGISTPYASIFRLPPNSELSLTKGTLHRFFPTAVVPEVGIEEAWDFAFDRAGTTIRALAERRKLLLSLTAGLDSRTTLAASRDTWPHLEFFTYNRGVRKEVVDRNVALDLTKIFGLRHAVVHYSQHEPDKRMLRVLSDNTFTPHKPKVACAYRRRFGEDVYLHIRSNLLELGRSNLFYKFGQRRRFEAPRTAGSMGDVYKRAAQLTPEKSAHVVPAFEHYVAAADFESTIGKASAWDLYFVEHRMGAWHAGVVTESDLSFDTVIAFNSREVVRHFMGVPEEIRCSSPHLRERLNALLPESKDIPINPGRYRRRPAA